MHHLDDPRVIGDLLERLILDETVARIPYEIDQVLLGIGLVLLIGSAPQRRSRPRTLPWRCGPSCALCWQGLVSLVAAFRGARKPELVKLPPNWSGALGWAPPCASSQPLAPHPDSHTRPAAGRAGGALADACRWLAGKLAGRQTFDNDSTTELEQRMLSCWQKKAAVS